MPNLQIFDRINDRNVPNLRSMPFETYFGEMEITEEQKRERVALAEDLEDTMTFMMYSVITQEEFGIENPNAKEQFRKRLRDTVGNHTEIDSELEEHFDEYTDDVWDTTMKHVALLLLLMEQPEEEKTEEDKEKQKSEEYYLSDDRARFLAEEESGTILNHSDYGKAIRLGYKDKTWHTMRDRHVRKDHERLEGKTIPIKELFAVGNSFMRYPRDLKYSPQAKQVVGCRCWVTYHR